MIKHNRINEQVDRNREYQIIDAMLFSTLSAVINLTARDEERPYKVHKSGQTRKPAQKLTESRPPSHDGRPARQAPCAGGRTMIQKDRKNGQKSTNKPQGRNNTSKALTKPRKKNRRNRKKSSRGIKQARTTQKRMADIKSCSYIAGCV